VQYGSQLVPISDDSMLKLPKEQVAQSMQLLGFVDNDPDNPAIPRHHYMKVSLLSLGYLMIDSKSNARHSQRHLSSHAMYGPLNVWAPRDLTRF